MTLQKPLNWFLRFVGSNEHQPIYHADKPDFSFTAKSQQRGPNTVQVVDPTPQWKSIGLELPTRMIEEVTAWIDTERKQDIEIFCINTDGVVTEHWFLQRARIRNKQIKRGRRINTNVMNLLVDYEWYRRMN